ncbi:barstar family protein [Moraxella bovis]|uniref:Barstar family protein n=1 Tax=Moraxella bovis TaxID=476 RepID=A0AAQ2Q811_MORBO|nr:barstar family protein [Moraxella bovis]UYZ75426.1 barstar family protein [Moraxella bovis]UYZ78631.1 barstar family protein [Moraxella bovis]UYZ81524.1 barstar family protein [Moraxella bovis]UYZ87113.1 barstar family protein [Moraxella bovis]UYZ92542.1 barstar family protein [Moraxella bovis]
MGIGGYFGSDLDGFDDCFDIFGVKDITVYWCDFNESNFKEKDIIVDILKERKLNVVLC